MVWVTTRISFQAIYIDVFTYPLVYLRMYAMCEYRSPASHTGSAPALALRALKGNKETLKSLKSCGVPYKRVWGSLCLTLSQEAFR